MRQSYDKDFYLRQQEGSRRSARVVVPLVMQLIRPRRVLDVGCGVGTWLSVFDESGVAEIQGVDGDYVDQSMLHVPAERFRAHDLRQPLNLGEQFDLVVSLEVAEHLPASCAEGFVKTLTAHGPVVLFSAATPSQGGTEHVNEQWPEYWLKLFEARGYDVVDCLRKRLWRNEEVEWCYAQNILLYVRSDYLEGHDVLKAEREKNSLEQLSLVHPRNLLHKVAILEELDPAKRSLKQILSFLPGLTKSAVGKRVKRILGASV